MKYDIPCAIPQATPFHSAAFYRSRDVDGMLCRQVRFPGMALPDDEMVSVTSDENPVIWEKSLRSMYGGQWGSWIETVRSCEESLFMWFCEEVVGYNGLTGARIITFAIDGNEVQRVEGFIQHARNRQRLYSNEWGANVASTASSEIRLAPEDIMNMILSSR